MTSNLQKSLSSSFKRLFNPRGISTYLKRSSYLALKYPLSKGINYFEKKEGDSLFYEAEFKFNKQEYNLRFSPQGDLLETEREIELDEILLSTKQNIEAALKENFKKSKIKQIQEVNPAGVKQYEVNIRVKNGNKFKGGFYKVMFDSLGKMLSIEEVKLNSIESVF